MKNIKLCLLAAIASFGFSAAANAWDADYTGKILSLDVYDGTPRVMVFLDGVQPTMPACKSNYAYALTSQPTYQTIASVLLAAKMADKSVRVYGTKDADGYCKIGYISLN